MTVAFVGSSSVEPTSPLPWALALELGLGTDWVALGRRGSRLSQWRRPALPRELRAIVVMIVGNDPRPTAAAIRDVDAAMRRHAPVVVWLPPPPYPADSRIAGRDALMRAALVASGVVQVDREVSMQPGHWSPDHVHPTRAGYQAYARQVGPMLWERLARPTVAATAPATLAVPDPSRGPTSIGQVFTAGGQRLEVTGQDALWLARACVGEGGGEADAYAVTSTMLRRWALLRDASPSSPFRTLTDLVVGRFAGDRPYEGEGREVALRGYSQPVSVQWRGAGQYAERRLQRRTMAWTDVEPWRRTAVLRVLTGRAPMTAWPAVHFAARRLVERRLAERPDWRVVDVPGADNVYVSVGVSRRYREPLVFGADGRRLPSVPAARPRGRVPSRPSSGGGLLAGLLLSGAALALRS